MNIVSFQPLNGKKTAQIVCSAVMLLSLLACQPSIATAKQKKNATSQPTRIQPNYGEKSENAFEFSEVWGYVMQGRENEFNSEMPMTDVGYFVSAVDTYSEMPEVPERDKFFKNYKGRVHLVTTVDSRSQAHLLLDPKLPLRKKIINQMVSAAKTYDALQIDWENIPKKDNDNFHSFLKELKKKEYFPQQRNFIQKHVQIKKYLKKI